MTPQQRQQLETNVLRLEDDKKRITDQLARVADGDVSAYVGGARLPEVYQTALNRALKEAIETLLTVDLAITDITLAGAKARLNSDQVSGEAKLGPTCGCTDSWRADCGERA